MLPSHFDFVFPSNISTLFFLQISVENSIHCHLIGWRSLAIFLCADMMTSVFIRQMSSAADVIIDESSRPHSDGGADISFRMHQVIALQPISL